MTFWCYICRDQKKAGIATRLCNERQKPVCPKHAVGCDKDGHGTSALREPPPQPDDECYCGCRRIEHWEHGSCMFNMIHSDQVRCMEFGLFRPAEAITDKAGL